MGSIRERSILNYEPNHKKNNRVSLKPNGSFIMTDEDGCRLWDLESSNLWGNETPLSHHSYSLHDWIGPDFNRPNDSHKKERLKIGEIMYPGDYLVSPNGNVAFFFEYNGNLSLLNNGLYHVLESNTKGTGGIAYLNTSGDLVVSNCTKTIQYASMNHDAEINGKEFYVAVSDFGHLVVKTESDGLILGDYHSGSDIDHSPFPAHPPDNINNQFSILTPLHPSNTSSFDYILSANQKKMIKFNKAENKYVLYSRTHTDESHQDFSWSIISETPNLDDSSYKNSSFNHNVLLLYYTYIEGTFDHLGFNFILLNNGGIQSLRTGKKIFPPPILDDDHTVNDNLLDFERTTLHENGSPGYYKHEFSNGFAFNSAGNSCTLTMRNDALTLESKDGYVFFKEKLNNQSQGTSYGLGLGLSDDEKEYQLYFYGYNNEDNFEYKIIRGQTNKFMATNKAQAQKAFTQY